MANRFLRIQAFGGLDERNLFSDDPTRSPDMNNFTVCEDGSLKKRPGHAAVDCDFNGKVYRMWQGYIDGALVFLVCADHSLYRYDFQNDSFTAVGGIIGACHHIFSFGNAVYFLCNTGYYKYADGAFEAVEPYAPLVAVSCLADGSGTLYEKVNMLTGKKRQRFSADGTSTVYKIGEKDIERVIYARINGENVENWTADTVEGTVTFETPLSAGLNNLEICWTKNTSREAMISDCTCSMSFGGNTDTRVFLYGNPNYPNYRFYSELADGLPSAEYFPETNYTVIGASAITDMVQQYDRQLIFTEDKAYYSYCELRSDTLGNYYPSFPIYNLNFEKGNLVKCNPTVIDNTPVTFSNDGLNRWVSTTVQDERNAVCFSGPIRDTVNRILQNGKTELCRFYDKQSSGELYFSTPYGLFIYNYVLGVWYKYDSINAIQFCEIPGRLYWIDTNWVLHYFSEEFKNDQGNTVNAYWRSPIGRFGAKSGKFDLRWVSVEANGENGVDITVTAEPREQGQRMNSQTVSETGTGSAVLKAYKFRTEIKRSQGARVTVSSSHPSFEADIKAINFKITDREAER